MIKAILFDLDGVLLDACEWHYEALNKALKEVSNTEISRDEHISTFNALSTKKKLELLTEQGRVLKKDHQLIWDKKQEYTIDTIISTAKIDGVKKAMHEFCRKNFIRLACVTNSIAKTAKLMLSSTGQLDYMNLVISNEDVKHIKPHGEGYIRAMIELYSMPDKCLIVEDSPVGKQAAYSTGAHVWEVSGCHEVNLENLKIKLAEINA